MTSRRQLSGAGKCCLLAAIALLVSGLLFGHPFPSLAGGLALALFLLTAPGRGAFDRLRFLQLPPARLIEDDERLLEIEYALEGAAAPLAVVLRSRGPIAYLDAGTPALLPTRLGRLPVRMRALKRGRHERLSFDVQLLGAFGFRPRSATFDVATDLWVLPRPRALRERVLEELLALRPNGVDRPQPTGPGDGEFFALRDWRPGDPERRIHPRLTARRGRKVLRLFRGEAPPLVHLLVDLRVATGRASFHQGDFDEAMRFAAGVVRALLRREVPVSLTLHDAREARLECAAGCRDLYAYLAALAKAKPATVPEPPGPLPYDPGSGRHVLLHLGQVDEASLSREWIAIRIGSQRYWQLLEVHVAADTKDEQLHAAVAGAAP